VELSPRATTATLIETASAPRARALATSAPERIRRRRSAAPSGVRRALKGADGPGDGRQDRDAVTCSMKTSWLAVPPPCRRAHHVGPRLNRQCDVEVGARQPDLHVDRFAQSVISEPPILISRPSGPSSRGAGRRCADRSRRGSHLGDRVGDLLPHLRCRRGLRPGPTTISDGSPRCRRVHPVSEGRIWYFCLLGVLPPPAACRCPVVVLRTMALARSPSALGRCREGAGAHPRDG
jgi:hypothetical protein